MLETYLTRIGFSEKERMIYLTLSEVGVQPASVVARRCGLDRVTVYKTLKKLSERGLIQVFFRNGVQCFGIGSFDALEVHLKERAQQTDELLKQFPSVSQVLSSMRGADDLVPHLQLFDGEEGMKSIFRDMLFEAKQEGILQIRMLSSNTFEDWQRDPLLVRTIGDFFTQANKRKLQVQLFEATGGIIPERVQSIEPDDRGASLLSFSRGMTSIYVVGHAVYLTCYKGSMIGLKIKQAEVSQIFHFLFDMLGSAGVPAKKAQ